jgi:hypothetical protein
MNTTTWVSRDQLIPDTIKKFEHVETVLDIGPGIQPQQYIKPLVHICAEPFHQYVERLQQIAVTAKDRAYVILPMTWAEAAKYFPEKSVDTVLLLDVIEHLEKKEGQELLEKTLRIARRQVIIFTPLGFVTQLHADTKDAWGLDGGSWQEHKSGWLPEDFSDGWEVIACKDFHQTDNMGKPRAEAAGALWAIHTQPSTTEPTPFRRVLLDLWQAGVRNNYRPTIRAVIKLLDASNKTKTDT